MRATSATGGAGQGRASVLSGHPCPVVPTLPLRPAPAPWAPHWQSSGSRRSARPLIRYEIGAELSQLVAIAWLWRVCSPPGRGSGIVRLIRDRATCGAPGRDGGEAKQSAAPKRPRSRRGAVATRFCGRFRGSLGRFRKQWRRASGAAGALPRRSARPGLLAADTYKVSNRHAKCGRSAERRARRGGRSPAPGGHCPRNRRSASPWSCRDSRAPGPAAGPDGLSRGAVLAICHTQC